MPSILSSSLRFLGANYFRFTVVVVVSFISPFAVAVAVTVRSSSAHSCVKIFPTARKRKSPKLLRAPTPPLLLRQICPASLTLVPLLMEIPHPSYGFCLITFRKNGLTVHPCVMAAERSGHRLFTPRPFFPAESILHVIITATGIVERNGTSIDVSCHYSSGNLVLHERIRCFAAASSSSSPSLPSFLPLRLLERPQSSLESRNCFRLSSSPREVLQCSKFQVLSQARRRRWIRHLVPNVDNSKINLRFSKPLHGVT